MNEVQGVAEEAAKLEKKPKATQVTILIWLSGGLPKEITMAVWNEKK